MKEQNWDDSLEDSKELFDAANLLPEDDEEQIKVASNPKKSQFTDLRRRIEERMDSKRIALEFEYDDLDDVLDSLQ